MPFKLAGGGVVLVNRGWLPRNIADRTAIEPFSTPAGDIEIEGIARADASRAFELGEGSAAHRRSARTWTWPRMRRNRLAAAAVRDPADERRRRPARARLAGRDDRRRAQLRLHVSVVGHRRSRARFRPVPRGGRRRSRPARERGADGDGAAGSFREV
jgi:hypothetical protein